MSDSPLLDALAAASPAPTAPAPPKGFEPGFKFTPGGNLDTVTFAAQGLGPGATQDQYDDAARAQGIPLPLDMSLQLIEVKMGHNPKAWQRDAEDRREKFTAYTAANTVWHYRFKVVPKSLWRGQDFEALMKEVRRARKGKGLTPKGTKTSEVIILGDFQAGKRDYLGGTPELLERSEIALEQVLAKIRRTKPTEIVLIDVGDALEGFASAPNAAQTNDLDLTEQLTVWRRILWRWISALSKFGIRLIILGVPSNHCRVRTGKNADGKPNDDWGLQTIGAVADMAAVNPAAYGHVEFHVPPVHDEHLAFTLCGGKTIGAAHGHQKGSPDALSGWLDGQSSGDAPVGQAYAVFFGHFHSLRRWSWGADRWAWVSPAMDNGSGWFSNLTGKKSRPGVLTVTFDEYGWRDEFIAWAA